MNETMSTYEASDLSGYSTQTLKNYQGHFTPPEIDERGYPRFITELFLEELLIYWTTLHPRLRRRKLRKLLDTLATPRWLGVISPADVLHIARHHHLRWVVLLMSDWGEDPRAAA